MLTRLDHQGLYRDQKNPPCPGLGDKWPPAVYSRAAVAASVYAAPNRQDYGRWTQRAVRYPSECLLSRLQSSFAGAP